MILGAQPLFHKDVVSLQQRVLDTLLCLLVDIYNSLNDSWTTTTLSQARDYFAATSVGHLALFAGGSGLDRVDIFLTCTFECPLADCIDMTCINSLCTASTFKPENTSCSDGVICNGLEVCDGVGNCLSLEPAPFNTTCDNGVWCDGNDDVCDGEGACVSVQDRCDINQECNNQCNEVEQNCFSDEGTLCTDGECTGWIFILQN